MTESFILLVDHEKICRLCLHSASGMSDIFQENEEISLQELVHKATGIKIESNDALPSKICYRCRHLVELACELQDMVEKTQALLTNAGSHATVEQSEVLKVGGVPNSQDTSCQQIPANKEMLDPEPACQELVVNTSENLAHEDLGFKKNNVDLLGNLAFYEDNKENEENNFSPSNRRKFPKHLTCQICLSVLTNLTDVETHVELHYVDTKLTSYLKLQRPYRCEECDNEAMSKTQVIVHHRRHLNINPYVCKEPGCTYVGKNQDSLRHHSLKHGACTKVCEVCGAAYRRSYELSQHTLRAHKAVPKQCQACGGQFRNVLSLRQHALKCRKPLSTDLSNSRRILTYNHCEAKLLQFQTAYPCDYPECAKAYHTRSELSAHARTHTDERLYRCRLCDVASYTSSSMLNRHLRMHARKRTLKCDKCSCTFCEYGAFYTHRVSSHGPWQPYRCVRCNRGYQSEASLKKHLNICESITKATKGMVSLK